MEKQKIVRMGRQRVGRTENKTGMYRESWQSNDYVYGARLKNGKSVDVPREEILRQTGRKRITETLLSELVGWVLIEGAECVINLAFRNKKNK